MIVEVHVLPPCTSFTLSYGGPASHLFSPSLSLFLFNWLSLSLSLSSFSKETRYFFQQGSCIFSSKKLSRPVSFIEGEYLRGRTRQGSLNRWMDISMLVLWYYGPLLTTAEQLGIHFFRDYSIDAPCLKTHNWQYGRRGRSQPPRRDGNPQSIY